MSASIRRQIVTRYAKTQMAATNATVTMDLDSWTTLVLVGSCIQNIEG